jgi:DNA-directed RNA polymerase I, II, and III subunit RPABC5
MIIPVRCFTCGKVIGNKWATFMSFLADEYDEGYVTGVPSSGDSVPKRWLCAAFQNSWLGLWIVADESSVKRSEALDQLGLTRYCCRRMLLTHVDLIEKLLEYNRMHQSLILPLLVQVSKCCRRLFTLV